MTLTSVDFELAWAALAVAEADQVALACHVNPDGDALGSMLGPVPRAARRRPRRRGARSRTRSRWRRTTASCPGLDLLTHPTTSRASPTSWSPSTAGRSAASATSSPQPRPPASSSCSTTTCRTRATAPSTSSTRPPPPAGCSCVGWCTSSASRSPTTPRCALYAALVCDTGRFQYETTTPERVRPRARAHQLRRAGLAPVAPAVRGAPLRVPEAPGRGAADAELDVDRRFVWTAVTQDMLRRHGVTLEEVEGLIDILRRTTEAEVTCVLKEEADGIGAGQPALPRRRRRAASSRPTTAGAATASRPASSRPSTSPRSSRPSATPSKPCDA